MANNSVEEIINIVKSQLTGNKQHDREVIVRSINEYAQCEEGPEIVKQLSKILYLHLTPDEIENFKEALRKDIPERYLFNTVNDDLKNNLYEEAFIKLDVYMTDKNRRFVNDDMYEYHCLDNDIEYALFRKYYTPKKEVRFISSDVELLKLYYLYGYLLIEKNELKKAEKYLKIALNYNPVSNQIIFELIDIYKRLNDWKNMYEHIQLAFKYAYTPSFLARAYRSYGYYHIEIKKEKVAAALYMYSLKYENNENAYHELEYLKQKGIKLDIKKDDVEGILEENNIQLVANSFVTREYKELGDRFSENKEFKKALEMYSLAYSLDDSLENQIRYNMTKAIVNGDEEVNIRI